MQEQYTTETFPVFNFYDKQRFGQYNPQDCANWYMVEDETGKAQKALYPTMGRAHIRYLNENRLIFGSEPRAIFRSIDYVYIVVGSQVYQLDKFFNLFHLINPDFDQTVGDLSFDYLPTVQETEPTNEFNAVFVGIANGINFFVIDERNKSFTTVTDIFTPAEPLNVVAFGNRFAVSGRNSTEFRLTQINLGSTFDASMVFHIDGQAVFAQEIAPIRRMAVLKSQLYIFTDFATGIWGNTPSSVFTGSGNVSFPWKRNTSYSWDYGIANPSSLDIGFGMMTFLAQNREGTVSFMASTGQQPYSITTQAINVLLQDATNDTTILPFLERTASGFLYQYENTVFYRFSAGIYRGFKEVDKDDNAISIEYNFNTKSWHRCIELNGERNRIQKHVYFNNRHLVTVQEEGTIYQMSGAFYTNENRNLLQTDPQADDAYIAHPMRYEFVTPIIFNPDYSEFDTGYVQIDFVWGDRTFTHWDGPFANTVFIETEDSDPDNQTLIIDEDSDPLNPTYIVEDGTDVPDYNSTTYNALFKPHIELLISDNSGVSYYSADNLEFSQLGVYNWRMRWYQCGTSRNRTYKLYCVSPSPIVVLGGIMQRKRASGGAN